jgi:hypothetical protein
MSLEKLMISDFQNWDEWETGVLFLSGVTFTPEFSEFIWNEFGKAPDIGSWSMVHGFGEEYPVILYCGDELELKFEISIELFTKFLTKGVKHD